MKLSDYEVRRRILYKMVRHAWWGGKHTAFDNLSHGFPKDPRGAVKKKLEQLIREGILVEKPTGYGLHVSLNVEKKAEIERIIFG
ncbi:MAG: hypothetical protein HY393_00640 [Candidatus Diapherotrites archaeon]|nr:hypothetical protein [Candidatus Diapherotrites archaeon]